MKEDRMEPFEVGIAEEAMRHARDLAFPRMVGSAGERAARRRIVRILEQSGYEVEQQRFRYVTSLHPIVTGQLIVGSLLILIALVMGAIQSSAIVIPVMLILALPFLSGRLYRSIWRMWVRSPRGIRVHGSARKPAPWNRWVPRHASTNLLARFRGQARDSSLAHLILIAHYDSKSQRLPLPIRVLLFVAVIVGALSFATFALLGLVVPTIAPLVIAIGVATLLAAVPLVFLKSGNNSPGAIDNASGVGLALSLAAHLASRSDLQDKVRISFLFAGAEEAGSMGAAAFLTRNKAELMSDEEQGHPHFLNLDGLGARGKLYLLGKIGKRDRQARMRILEIARRSCREAGYPMGRLASVGVLFDHIPFSQQGFDSMSLVSMGRESNVIHTARDTSDRLSKVSLERAGRVVLDVIETLASPRSEDLTDMSLRGAQRRSNPQHPEEIASFRSQ